MTESSKKYFFTSVEPQVLRDYSGPGNTLLYEGFAAPGVKTDEKGWVIVVHDFDANNMDIGQRTKSGLEWDLRSFYTFT